MPIHQLLRERGFDPESVQALIAAYEECLSRLQLRNKEDPLTATLAKKIIDTASAGERDPKRLCQQALDALGR
jgi:hypothetical protein